MSLLPVHNAVEISPTKLEGGTTLPFIVVAEDGNAYVIKLFKKIHARQRCYTAAEAFGHLIAKKFELRVPEAALILLPPGLIKLIKKNNPDLYKEILTRDYTKPCFATRYLGNLPTFSPALLKKKLETHELETIFAFDTLILNEDRKIIKPNILRDKSGYVLIDHEKAFEGTEYALNRFKAGLICEYTNNHLFFKTLHQYAKRNGAGNMFETFEDYFRQLRLADLNQLRLQLSDYKYNTEECVLWQIYLEDMKRNFPNFVKMLRGSIS
ncbi:MAG: hypothetical protein HYZ14_03270 [Bacteroidetes bacterium]|nr:hypothetical protein [Bacteroidota bacterium]